MSYLCGTLLLATLLASGQAAISYPQHIHQYQHAVINELSAKQASTNFGDFIRSTLADMVVKTFSETEGISEFGDALRAFGDVISVFLGKQQQNYEVGNLFRAVSDVFEAVGKTPAEREFGERLRAYGRLIDHTLYDSKGSLIDNPIEIIRSISNVVIPFRDENYFRNQLNKISNTLNLNSNLKELLDTLGRLIDSPSTTVRNK